MGTPWRAGRRTPMDAARPGRLRPLRLGVGAALPHQLRRSGSAVSLDYSSPRNTCRLPVHQLGLYLKSPADGALRSSGGRVLSVTATEPTLAKARTAAYRLVDAIELPGGQHRTYRVERRPAHRLTRHRPDTSRNGSGRCWLASEWLRRAHPGRSSTKQLAIGSNPSSAQTRHRVMLTAVRVGDLRITGLVWAGMAPSRRASISTPTRTPRSVPARRGILADARSMGFGFWATLLHPRWMVLEGGIADGLVGPLPASILRVRLRDRSGV